MGMIVTGLSTSTTSLIGDHCHCPFVDDLLSTVKASPLPRGNLLGMTGGGGLLADWRMTLHRCIVAYNVSSLKK